jgi:hypothetical protein
MPCNSASSVWAAWPNFTFAGFSPGRCYDAIPLEVNAYSPGARFGAGPEVPFSVESEGSSWIKEGRFEPAPG